MTERLADGIILGVKRGGFFFRISRWLCRVITRHLQSVRAHLFVCKAKRKRCGSCLWQSFPFVVRLNFMHGADGLNLPPVCGTCSLCTFKTFLRSLPFSMKGWGSPNPIIYFTPLVRTFSIVRENDVSSNYPTTPRTWYSNHFHHTRRRYTSFCRRGSTPNLQAGVLIWPWKRNRSSPVWSMPVGPGFKLSWTSDHSGFAIEVTMSVRALLREMIAVESNCFLLPLLTWRPWKLAASRISTYFWGGALFTAFFVFMLFMGDCLSNIQRDLIGFNLSITRPFLSNGK